MAIGVWRLAFGVCNRQLTGDRDTKVPCHRIPGVIRSERPDYVIAGRERPWIPPSGRSHPVAERVGDDEEETRDALAVERDPAARGVNQPNVGVARQLVEADGLERKLEPFDRRVILVENLVAQRIRREPARGAVAIGLVPCIDNDLRRT